MDGAAFPELNNVKWPVTDGGETIGSVTSAIYSPRLDRNIGFAWLPSDRSTLGATAGVRTEWGDRTATVVEMPFVDPKQADPGLLTDDRRTPVNSNLAAAGRVER